MHTFGSGLKVSGSPLHFCHCEPECQQHDGVSVLAERLYTKDYSSGEALPQPVVSRFIFNAKTVDAVVSNEIFVACTVRQIYIRVWTS